MTFCENLARLLKEKGETPYRLAKDLGCSESTVSYWLRGKTLPTPIMKKLVAQHFGVEESAIDNVTDKGGEAQ